MHVFGWWEEVGVPGENPRIHENMQTPYRKAWVHTRNPLNVRQKCEPLHHHAALCNYDGNNSHSNLNSDSVSSVPCLHLCFLMRSLDLALVIAVMNHINLTMAEVFLSMAVIPIIESIFVYKDSFILLYFLKFFFLLVQFCYRPVPNQLNRLIDALHNFIFCGCNCAKYFKTCYDIKFYL